MNSGEITIILDISVLGALATAAILVACWLVVYYYLRMARQVAMILSWLEPAEPAPVDPAFRAKLMVLIGREPALSSRRIALTRRARAAGVNI